MRQLASIAWKEWHELRIFLWIALGVFIGLPFAGGLEQLTNAPMHRFAILASPWVVALGGVLAVFIAVSASCRDFSGHLEDFWKSRPVGIVRWLLIKYSVGLLIVLAACLLPLAVERWIDNGPELSTTELVSTPFQWIAIYSLAFLAGCIVRRTAHAAMLGLAGMLLVYFLPMVLPFLAWIDVASLPGINYWNDQSGLWNNYLHNPAYLRFALGLLAVGLIALAISILAVWRDWRVDSGRKMMYGSVSAALIILVSSAGFQLGTNLPVLQQITLPADEFIREVKFDGASGYVVTSRPFHGTYPASMVGKSEEVARAIRLTSSGIELGDVGSGNKSWWVMDQTTVNYSLVEDANANGPIVTLQSVKFGEHMKEMVLPMKIDTNSNPIYPTLFQWKDHLYVIGSDLIVLDASRPLSPQIISNEPTNYRAYWGALRGEDKAVLNLPPLPDLDSQTRLSAALQTMSLQGIMFDGEFLCRNEGDALIAYRLTDLTDVHATFEKVAQFDQTMLFRLFGSFRYSGIGIQNGLLYAYQDGNNGRLNPVIHLFEMPGSQPLRPIGHFAAPGIRACSPLPDGRTLVGGGNKLWLVGPPTRVAQN